MTLAILKESKMNPKQRYNKKQKLLEEYGSCCWWCKSTLLEKNLTMDHLKPRSKGGSNSLENLRLACRKCNQKRGNSLFPPKIAANRS